MGRGCCQHMVWGASHLARPLLLGEDAVVHLLHNAAASPSPQPAAGAPRTSPFPAGISLTVGVLSAVFSLTFLVVLYAKYGRRLGIRGGDRYGGGAGGKRPETGLARAIVESLPVFPFVGGDDGLECPVCLRRFAEPDLLRLLPKCKHAFHVGCVDTWLATHSTCPLCRRKVEPEDILLTLQEASPGQKPHGERHGTADVVVEEETSPLERWLSKSEEVVRVTEGGFRASNPRSSAWKKLRRRSADDVLLLRGAAPLEQQQGASGESLEMVLADAGECSAWHGCLSSCSSSSSTFSSGAGRVEGRGEERGAARRWRALAAAAREATWLGRRRDANGRR